MTQRLYLILIFVLLSSACRAQYKRYHGDGIDDILRFVPVASVYALKAAGVDGKSTWKRLAVNTATAFAIDISATYLLKETIHSRRPDGTDRRGFPSGHTSLAFCGAMILHKEYGSKSPWISAAGFTLAAITAADRVRRNRHHWQDVAAGAAIGVLSAEAGYRLGDLITGEHDNTDLVVTPTGLHLIVKL